MQAEISKLSMTATPDGVVESQIQKFDLKILVHLNLNKSLGTLSDKEIFDLIYPIAIREVTRAADDISANTNSKLERALGYKVRCEFGSGSEIQRYSASLHQQQNFSGSVTVDTDRVSNTGESWQVSLLAMCPNIAESIVSNVLAGLGRQTVDFKRTVKPLQSDFQLTTRR